MNSVSGKCLCEEVAFELTATLPNIYQCHCSLCRKATGSSSNAALIVSSAHFKWVRGHERITAYVKDTGYRADFCSKCGSQLPNPIKGGTQYWIPAGLLDADAGIEVAAHLHVGSKASWDEIASNGIQYQEAPDLENLLKVLQRKAGA